MKNLGLEKKFIIGLVLGIALMIQSQWAHAEDVVIYAEDAFVPFSFENGEGLSNQIVKEAFKAAGVNADIKVTSFSLLMKMVAEGTAVGGFNAVPTPETNQEFFFGKYPIYMTHMYFYYYKEDPVIIDSMNDIMTKLVAEKISVGDVLGYIYPTEYTALKEAKDSSKRLMADSVNSDDILIKKLKAKRNRVALMTAEVADYNIETMGFKDQFGHGKYVWEAPLYVAFSKKNPQGKHFLELFDKGMNTIMENGKYKEILSKYPFLK